MIAPFARMMLPGPHNRQKLRKLRFRMTDNSQRKWRAAHPDYQHNYRQNHPESAEQNRERQRVRDRKYRLVDLEKNNLAFNLKHSNLEVWLIGSVAGDLEKNNLASSQVLIVQQFPVQPVATAPS